MKLLQKYWTPSFASAKGFWLQSLFCRSQEEESLLLLLVLTTKGLELIMLEKTQKHIIQTKRSQFLCLDLTTTGNLHRK